MHTYAIFPMQALGLFELSGSPDYAIAISLTLTAHFIRHL